MPELFEGGPREHAAAVAVRAGSELDVPLRAGAPVAATAEVR